MSQVISFEDYRPAARFDAVPWTQAEIQEAATADGVWATIDTIALSPLDTDPAAPRLRSFTTDDASDTPALWYRVIFLDATAANSQPTTPVQNIQPVPGGRDLCTLADVLTYVPGYRQNDDTDAKLQQLISSESLLTQLEVHREILPIDTQPSTRVFAIGEWELLNREVLIGDLATTTSLVVELHGADGALVQTVAAGAIVPLAPDGQREEWEPYTSLTFPPLYLDTPPLARGYTLHVTGTFGFPSIPAFIREACAKRVLLRYITDVATKGTSLSDAIDDVNPAALFASSRDALNAIRVPVIG